MARICMVVHAYYPYDVRVRREAQALADDNHSVEVICLRDENEGARDHLNGVQIHRLPIRKERGGVSRYFFEYLAFFALVAFYLALLNVRRRFQIIHVHNMPDFLVFSAIIPRLFGSKIILDVHDPMPELFVSIYGLEPDHWVIGMLRFQEKASCLFADLIITVNNSMRERIIGLGIVSNKVFVVFNSPDIALQKPTKTLRRNRPRVFTLVYAGTIAKRYGLDVAVEAIASLTGKMKDIKLLIIGSGNYMQELRELILQCGMQQFIELRGNISHEALINLLGQCDAGISPHRNDSFWKLYFSTKILEYFSVGLPVVSSRTKTIEAYLKDSVFYFEPGDALGMAKQIRLLRTRPDLVKAKKKIAEGVLLELRWENEKTKLRDLVLELAA